MMLKYVKYTCPFIYQINQYDFCSTIVGVIDNDNNANIEMASKILTFQKATDNASTTPMLLYSKTKYELFSIWYSKNIKRCLIFSTYVIFPSNILFLNKKSEKKTWCKKEAQCVIKISVEITCTDALELNDWKDRFLYLLGTNS